MTLNIKRGEDTFSPWYIPLNSNPVYHQWIEEKIKSGVRHRCARCMLTRTEAQRLGTESACDQILRLPYREPTSKENDNEPDERTDTDV